MSKQQKKREPLLYIHQPEFQTTKVKMQESYSLKQAEKRKLQHTKKDKIFEEKPKKAMRETREFDTLSSEEVQQTIQDYDQEKSEVKPKRNEFGLRRLKPFREMDIEEKIDYLYQFPRQLPPVPCLFQTENNVLRGILIEKTDEEIHLRLFDKSEVSVPIKELLEVKMIGLN